MKELPQIIKEILNARSPRVLESDGYHTRHAAVLIPLYKADGRYKILFTKRTYKVEAHKGQISFPGGGVDETDGSYEATALREAFEEIGLQRKDVIILGRADDEYTVASNYIVHPFIGWIPYPYPFKINTFEVHQIIEVPFDVFQQRGSQDIVIPQDRSPIYEGTTYYFDGEVIWGATARIMENLITVLEEKIGLPAQY